jgi:copper transport protein
VPLARVRVGGYTVRWHVVSADSHVASGVWTFGFGVPAPPVGHAFGAGGPTRLEHVVRWLWFLGLAAAVGALAVRLLVLRALAVPRAIERRLAVVAGAGVVASLQAGVAAFSLRAEDALQLPFGRFLYGDLSPMAQTRFGTAFIVMTLGYALVLALVYLAWLLDLTTPLVPAFVLALLLLAGLSVSGHDGVDAGSSWASAAADWAHLAAAAVWIGGLAVVAGVVWRGMPDARGIAFARFSRLATVLVAVVIAAGTYLAIVRLPRLDDLWTTGYGHVLLVKLALVSLALAWGGFHRVVVRPLVARGEPGFLSRVGGSLAGEAAVGAAVLLAAAVLVDSAPPRPIDNSDRSSRPAAAQTTLRR